jgi:hypothetical protein
MSTSGKCSTCCDFIALASLIVALLFTSPVCADEPPQDIDEGIRRLEEILGQFASKDARQFRIKIDSESEGRPKEDEPAVLTVSQGELILGNPYRVGGAAAFDMVESIRRVVSQGKGDERKVVRRQQRYMAARYSLRPEQEGAWSFDTVMMAHSIPSAAGRVYLTGTVQWLPNGIQLHGIGTDNVYGSDGKLIPVSVYAKVTITRENQELIVDDQWQSYHLASAPGDVLLPVPDFSRPIDKPFKWLAGKGSRE